MIEIERKFLVKNDEWKKYVSRTASISQGYLPTGTAPDIEETSVRIREYGGEVFITFKGRADESGRSRFELEKRISMSKNETSSLLKRCTGTIEKIRYIVPHHKEKDLMWEVDEFLDPNPGLVIAEIELSDPDRHFDLPNWIGTEVTDDPRYLNINLVQNPLPQSGDP